MQLLDALDSELERQGGDGVWGPISTEFTRRGPRVRIPHSGWSASTIHRSPQIPSSAEGTTSTTTEERLNAALWKYSEHVATLIETQLNEFVHQN